MLAVSFDLSDLNGKLAEIVKLTKEEPAKVMVQEARLLCVELCKYTQPFGLDDKARQQGEEALARDYARVYAQADAVYKELQLQNKEMADGFWKAFQARNFAKATKILQQSQGPNRNTPILPFDGGEAHKRRWNRGKVGGGITSSMILQVQKGLKPFLTQEKAKVGWAKAGWATCAKSLGGVRGIPAWIYNHDTPGTVIDNTDKETPSLTIRNNVNFTTQVLSDTAVRDAVKDRGIKLAERIKKILASEFHKLNSKHE